MIMQLLFDLLRPALRWLPGIFLVLLAAVAPAPAWAVTLSPDGAASDRPLGMALRYMQEGREKLTLDEARAAFARGEGTAGRSRILSIGMGLPSVWIHLPVHNPQAEEDFRRLSIETAWLDEVDIHFVEKGTVVANFHLGDAWPFDERPLPERFLSVEHGFAPGDTDVYIRVATPDPIVLPIYLRDRAHATDRQRSQSYSYGFLYGYLVALLAYNALIFVSIRDRRYLLYSAFLAGFVAMNLAYTGHGFQWLWPDGVTVQRSINPALMTLFALMGLAFARSFLDTPKSLPRINPVLNTLMLVFPTAFALAFIFGDTQLPALRVAFLFVLVFSVVMPALGIWAVRFRIANARYFLLASLASAIGACITALSVWGIIEFEEWRYRAVEIGMLIDATLLAIALGGQFRAAQLENVRAEIAGIELAEVNRKLNESLRELEHVAATDRLTGLWNRRHFDSVATAEMERAARYKSPTALLIFDIDHFKAINDTCGHQTGDEVLKELAQVVRRHMRESDSVTRWGGEEFTALMPNTGLAAAGEAGEKLRHAVEAYAFPRGLKVSISVGAAEWAGPAESLDRWVARADDALYQAKHAGRNRVVSAAPPADLSRSPPDGPPVLLHWNARYESGNAEIDFQHRELFESANRLLGLVSLAGAGPRCIETIATIIEAIDTLLVEVQEHFTTEEQILAERNWQGLHEHRAEHAQLLMRAQGLRRELAEGAPGFNAAALADFVSIDLVTNHLLRFDRNYFPSLGTSGEVGAEAQAV